MCVCLSNQITDLVGAEKYIFNLYINLMGDDWGDLSLLTQLNYILSPVIQYTAYVIHSIWNIL